MSEVLLLHEMDDGIDEQLQRDTAPSTSTVSMHSLAEPVRNEIHEAIAPLKAKLVSMQATLEGRVRAVEEKIGTQHVRIETLEKFIGAMGKQSRTQTQMQMQ